MQGAVHSMFIAEAANTALIELKQAELVANRGILGDRYYKGTGTFSEMLADKPFKDLTLIELEEINLFNQKTGLNIAASDFRRNIITKNVRLNELVGRDFFIGNVKLRGIRLCEPCQHLADVLTHKILPEMTGKSGLRAQILTSGNIFINDSIKESSEHYE